MSLEEEVLHGGHVSTVVRVGDTVRRTSGPWTPTIHRLLLHVRKRGVTWVPEPRGFDDLDREILSFIPGDVPHEMSAWTWSEVVLLDVACALRHWHDATLGFDVTDARWNLVPPTPHEVICHSDFAPYNCVFRDGRFAGAIDFDFCAPGPRLWDIASTAYRFVPLMPAQDDDTSAAPGERSPFSAVAASARLHAFIDAYSSAGEPLRYEPMAVIAATIDRLRAIAAWTAEHVRTTHTPALERHAEMYLAHARWLGSWPKTR